ncbi:hypothetical protein GY45DRAFT_961510 [Cubamyces sp. BRFM 1775]|nr:hypothetical protein GY45DRAFT_961510 [Cubamyces sp. BRFM 1775]
MHLGVRSNVLVSIQLKALKALEIAEPISRLTYTRATTPNESGRRRCVLQSIRFVRWPMASVARLAQSDTRSTQPTMLRSPFTTCPPPSFKSVLPSSPNSALTDRKRIRTRGSRARCFLTTPRTDGWRGDFRSSNARCAIPYGSSRAYA